MGGREKKYRKSFVLSLGGSVIIPDGGFNTQFLKDFEAFIRRKIAAGLRFFIVCGGGATCRKYRDAADAVMGGKVSNEDLDWLGVHSTRLNSHLIRTIFRDIAYRRVIDNYDVIDKRPVEPIVLASGWKPGWSTDYNAVLLAQDYGVKEIINLTNVSYVYDKDPKKHEDAKPKERLTWDELIKIVGTKWIPGMYTPFDPVAAQLAKRLGLEVVVTDGKDLKNLDNILEGRRFKGTVIK
jgi:uridylate kinase